MDFDIDNFAALAASESSREWIEESLERLGVSEHHVEGFMRAARSYHASGDVSAGRTVSAVLSLLAPRLFDMQAIKEATGGAYDPRSEGIEAISRGQAVEAGLVSAGQGAIGSDSEDAQSDLYMALYESAQGTEQQRWQIAKSRLGLYEERFGNRWPAALADFRRGQQVQSQQDARMNAGAAQAIAGVDINFPSGKLSKVQPVLKSGKQFRLSSGRFGPGLKSVLADEAQELKNAILRRYDQNIKSVSGTLRRAIEEGSPKVEMGEGNKFTLTIELANLTRPDRDYPSIGRQRWRDAPPEQRKTRYYGPITFTGRTATGSSGPFVARTAQVMAFQGGSGTVFIKSMTLHPERRVNPYDLPDSEYEKFSERVSRRIAELISSPSE